MLFVLLLINIISTRSRYRKTYILEFGNNIFISFLPNTESPAIGITNIKIIFLLFPKNQHDLLVA